MKTKKKNKNKGDQYIDHQTAGDKIYTASAILKIRPEIYKGLSDGSEKTYNNYDIQHAKELIYNMLIVMSQTNA